MARPDETFMRCVLTGHPLADPPAGYAVEVTRNPVIGVRVLKDGEQATTGLLFSSADGVHPYSKLGWEKIPDLVVARNEVSSD